MSEALQSTSDRRTQIAPPRLRELAARQWSVFSRAQLRHCGFSGAGIARAVARGWLVRIHPGVYALGHGELPIEGRLMAALLYAGPGSALSHTTAAWWWRLLKAPPRVIHVSSAHRRRPRHGLRLHLPRTLDRVRHRRLPITPVSRTLLDLAVCLGFDELRRALAEADYRDLLDPAEAAAVCGSGRPGSATLRKALEAHLPRLAETLSVLEERFLLLCESHNIPLPEVNAVVDGMKVDALWPRSRTIVELDGHEAHAAPAAVERDRARELKLRASGYRVLRYTWQQVTEHADRVAVDLRMALS
jgi:predicted transcriptional regulator of viral defense system